MPPDEKQNLLQHPGIRKWYDYFQHSPLYDPGTADRYLQVMASPYKVAQAVPHVPNGFSRRTHQVQALILQALNPGDSVNLQQMCARLATHEMKPASVASGLVQLFRKGVLNRSGSPRVRIYALKEK